MDLPLNMFLRRRHLFLAVLAAFVIVVSVLGYLKLADRPDNISPFQAISSDAVAVLSVNDFSRAHESLVFKSMMWQEVQAINGLSTIHKGLIALDSLIDHSDADADLLGALRMQVVYYPLGSKGYDHCMVISLPTNHQEDFEGLLMAISPGKTEYGNYEEVEVFTLNTKDSSIATLYYARLNNLAILAFTPDRVEHAIHIIHQGGSIYEDQKFLKVQRTTGEFSDWNLFIDYSSNGGLQLIGLDKSKMESAGISWSGWTALDVTLHPDLVLLNGFTLAPQNSFLALFNEQRSQDIDAVDIIPDDAALFFHFGVSDYERYSNEKQKYLKSELNAEELKGRQEELSSIYGIDLEVELKKWVANEFGLFYTDSDGKASVPSKVIYFRLADKKSAIKFCNDLAIESGGENDRLSVLGLFDGMETPLFSSMDKPYFDIIDKYLVLSSDRGALNHVRSKYRRAQTLQKSVSYNELTAEMSDQSNVYLYIHLKKGLSIYRELMSSASLSLFQSNEEVLTKFEHLGIQFKDGNKSMFYQHTTLDYNPVKRKEGKTLWQVELDAPSKMKPRIVYNHYTNAREIFIQDQSNVIYLIDNRGNILWKRQLKEPILSEIYQIDVFKNNKLQLLFSGESSIYLIDRKGRDVENFPIQLPAVTTNGLSVIDYEKNREYRILIGVRGGKVLNFDRFGKPISGWKFECKEEISSPIRHFVLGGKDYICFVGSDGSPFVVNRRGEHRLEIKNSLGSAHASRAELELSNDISQCRFVTTDETGNVVKLKFDGTKETINFESFSPEHQFVYGDLNNDRKMDYIFLDSNRLLAYDHAREKLFEASLDKASAAYLSLYHFGDEMDQLGFTDTSAAQLYLYTDVGDIHQAFPLQGNSGFSISDINKDDRFNLIVNYKQQLVVYNLE
ncbi:MAG: DUF3352 domain-containing protein [Vicingaceae bacterium]